MTYIDRISAKNISLLQKSLAISKIGLGIGDVLDPTKIGGIDTDFWANRMDFSIAKQNGIQFAFIRAGQGFAVDPQFYYSWKNAKQNGIKRGWYWFLDTRYSIRGQAKILVNEIKGDTGELPGVIDFEQDVWFKVRGNQKRKHLNSSELYAFGVYLKEYIPNIRLSLLYGAYSYLLTWLPNPDMSKFAGLWFADPTRGRIEPVIPKSYPKPLFWQWSFAGQGPLYGTQEKGIDLDYFMGTQEEFNGLCL